MGYRLVTHSRRRSSGVSFFLSLISPRFRIAGTLAFSSHIIYPQLFITLVFIVPHSQRRIRTASQSQRRRKLSSRAILIPLPTSNHRPRHLPNHQCATIPRANSTQRKHNPLPSRRSSHKRENPPEPSFGALSKESEPRRDKGQVHMHAHWPVAIGPQRDLSKHHYHSPEPSSKRRRRRHTRRDAFRLRARSRNDVSDARLPCSKQASNSAPSPSPPASSLMLPAARITLSRRIARLYGE